MSIKLLIEDNKMKNKNFYSFLFKKLFIFVFSFFIVFPILAHDNAYLDSLKTPHGGQIRMAGLLHLEFMLSQVGDNPQNKLIMVYVTDHAGVPQSTVGASGAVTISEQIDHNIFHVTLTPDGDHALSAQISLPVVKELTAVVDVKLAGQSSQQARFIIH